jgi:hypothetical protein
MHVYMQVCNVYILDAELCIQHTYIHTCVCINTLHNWRSVRASQIWDPRRSRGTYTYTYPNIYLYIYTHTQDGRSWGASQIIWDPCRHEISVYQRWPTSHFWNVPNDRIHGKTNYKSFVGQVIHLLSYIHMYIHIYIYIYIYMYIHTSCEMYMWVFATALAANKPFLKCPKWSNSWENKLYEFCWTGNIRS